MIKVDHGSILTQARYYRGAFQTEGEQDATRRILNALLGEQQWIKHRSLLIYETARLLPHGRRTAQLTSLRADADALQ